MEAVARLRPVARRLRLEYRLKRIARVLRYEELPTRALMSRLVAIWGNPNFGADPDYLMLVAQWSARAQLPILECGSGITTIVASRYASSPVHCLEHIPDWAIRMRRATAALGLSACVYDAPLTDYGDFDWYTVPKDLPSQFGLVICDGPPHVTRGGRYGLLRVLNLRLGGSTIILDDADRPSEVEVVERWHQEFGVSCLRHDHAAILMVESAL